MDHILYWNAVALEANRRDFTDIPTGASVPMPEQGGPTLSSRALAIVLLTMYDAHAAVVGGSSLPAYLPGLPGKPAGATADAAVAGAAHRALSALFTRQQAAFDAALAVAPLSGTAIRASIAFGVEVANALLADRGGDPGAGATGHVHSQKPGRHRPDPVAQHASSHAPWYGASAKLFATPTRLSLDPPPAKGSRDYNKALKQVRGKGVAPELMGTLPAAYAKRTTDETMIGLFWAYDVPPNLGTPPRLYNQIVREVACAEGNDADENARLFALVNAAMGDAGILAWADKYKYDFWRPVLGIREHDASMGPMPPTPGSDLHADCDPEWRPLGAPASNVKNGVDFTPPFPAYPSGHATFGAAALHMTRLFYDVPKGNRANDRVWKGPFVSEELNGATKDARGVIRPRHSRMFDGGLWQMIVENGLSRVYLGVHWSFDAFALTSRGAPDFSKFIGGVPLGLKIAESIFQAGAKKGPKKSTA